MAKHPRSLGTKTGPRKSSTEALHSCPGSLDIERPGFLYFFGPLSPRGQWTRRVTKWNLGMTAVSNPKSLSTPQSQHRYEKGRLGVSSAWNVRGDGDIARFARTERCQISGQAWTVVITLARGNHHALGRHVTFSSPSREEIVRGIDGESLMSAGRMIPPGLFGVKDRDALPPGRCHQTRHLGPMAA